MRVNFSKILVYITLLLLASFLAFWLHSEYQREKTALQNESYLGIADKLIGLNGGDLYRILSELENHTKDSSVFIDFRFSDSTDIRKMEDTAFLGSRQIAYVGGDINDGEVIPDDSFQEITKMIKTKNGDASIAIIVKSDANDELLTMDTLKRKVSMEFVESLQSNLEEDKAVLHKKALRNIIPEFFFAVSLFGFLTFGIYSLQKSNAKDQELLESKNNLISNLTHELKTPITTIGVALEAIQDFNVKADKEKTARYIETSRTELNRLSSAIDQVMMLSKLGRHSGNYNFQIQDIKALSQEVIQNLQLQIDSKKARVQLHGTDQVIAKVDETHFKRMLYNLIDNSLKYGQQGVQIDISLNSTNNKATIRLKDNGPGIASKYHRKIFERFYRISDGDRHDVKGYGLGLSYVKEIVKAHKGKIKLESQVGEGTVFSIEL